MAASISLCNCRSHFSIIPSKTPFTPIQCNFPLRRRKTTTSATSSTAETHPIPQSSIQRIADKLRSLGYIEETVKTESLREKSDTKELPASSPGEIFVPLRTHLPKHRVGHTLDPSWSTPQNPVSSKTMEGKEREEERVRKRKESEVPSLAELTVPVGELRRLRSEGVALKKKIKLGKAGITEGIVNGIHERWRTSEVVRIACEDICRMNMKRTHDLLEKKTGGLVVWRSGSNIILYRGPNYKYPYFLTEKSLLDDSSSAESAGSNSGMDQGIPSEMGEYSLVTNAVDSPASKPSIRSFGAPIVQGVGLPNRVRFQLPGEAQLAEEADALLEGLGPRFTDWWSYDPLPVDADLLPAVVTGYKRPFRLLPYGVKPKLTNDEMTTLRRLGRPLPCHFALGRNSKLQGLAAAIVKLWEKCEIVKIAVKRGVHNTNSELMAEELKKLTEGTLLSRDSEFIVFYRGKDFLPPAVSSAIEERRKNVMDVTKNKPEVNEYATEAEDIEERRLKGAEAAMERTSTELLMALEKKAHAEKSLADLEKEQTCQPGEIDKEGITDEERHMLRRVGLRMKPFLLLGRRGVFDGTVENMHLHWKYRELVKVCMGRSSIKEIHEIARTLEAESGGILVAVEPTSKGYAIIVYRGKNYKRPATLRPQTLLSKREAMKRSKEAQRRESLKLHVLKLDSNIDDLKHKLAKEESEEHPRDMRLKHVNEQDIYEDDSEEGLFHEDALSDEPLYFEDHVNEENSVNIEAVASYTDPNNLMSTSEAYVETIEEDKPRDVSTPSEAKPKYLFDTTPQELQPGSVIKASKHSPTQNQQRLNFELPFNRQAQDRTSSSGVAYQMTTLDIPVSKSMDEKPAVLPPRVSKLSNKERLILRKQALNMRHKPVLAVGKSNVVTGVAKAIKTHFEKHPLAIVSIKGRAKGTSIQEVIHNLEQATDSVLVSQEPSKVILYRGWGSEPKPSRVDAIATRPVISPELLAAIRLECGLNATSDKQDASAPY